PSSEKGDPDRCSPAAVRRCTLERLGATRPCPHSRCDRRKSPPSKRANERAQACARTLCGVGCRTLRARACVAAVPSRATGCALWVLLRAALGDDTAS